MSRAKVFWWSRILFLFALVLLGAGCERRVVSARTPTPEKLSCAQGESPVALRFYEGRYEWSCGTPACPSGEEAVWEPVRGSTDRHGVQEVSAKCLAPCDGGKSRMRNGRCPGRYTLASRFDGDTLIVSANIDRIPVEGVTVSFDHSGLENVTGKTGPDGTARFDTTAEPFSSVLLKDMARSEKSFASGGSIGGLLASDWDALGAFKDGTVAKTTVLVGSSSPYRKAKQEAEARDEARVKGLQEKCNGGDAATCLQLARLHQGRGRQKEAVAAARRSCDLGLQEACDDLANGSKSQPPGPQDANLKSVQKFNGTIWENRKSVNLVLNVAKGDHKVSIKGTGKIGCVISVGSVEEGFKQVLVKDGGEGDSCSLVFSSKAAITINLEVWRGRGGSGVVSYTGELLFAPAQN